MFFNFRTFHHKKCPKMPKNAMLCDIWATCLESNGGVVKFLPSFLLGHQIFLLKFVGSRNIFAQNKNPPRPPLALHLWPLPYSVTGMLGPEGRIFWGWDYLMKGIGRKFSCFWTSNIRKKGNNWFFWGKTGTIMQKFVNKLPFNDLGMTLGI